MLNSTLFFFNCRRGTKRRANGYGWRDMKYRLLAAKCEKNKDHMRKKNFIELLKKKNMTLKLDLNA